MARKPKGAGAAGDGRALDTGDNRQARLDAEQAQFLSACFKYRAKLRDIDTAKAVVDGHKAEAKEILDMAVAAGFKKYEITDQVADLIKPKVNHSEIEDRRARFREWLGLPAGRRPTDELKMPEEAKDAIAWEYEGLRAGMRADEPKPVEVPPRFHQAWLKGWHEGQARNVAALAYKPAPAAAPVPEPEPEKEPSRAELKAQEKAVREGLDKLAHRRPGDALEAIREAEPELVDQVVADHADEETV
jgi:hypothetical protein